MKRYHPAVVAQMAATTACLAANGFTLGVGTGEHLNEHVVGGEWPDPAVRHAQLREAVEIIRRLFSGDETTLYGEWFTVDRARLFTLPDEPPPIVVAAGGPDAARLAAELDAGLVTVGPNGDLVEAYRVAGGNGPVIAQASVCWHTDAGEAKRIMRERWRQGVLGWDAIAELPTPAAFEAATQSVREDDVVGSKPIGSDVDAYLSSLSQFQDAGYDRVLIHNIGREQSGFLEWAQRQLLPGWRSSS
ncbi:MAG: TIGR03557 family F420-dependent LLM class oxidoreductase [Actinomycetota bacterium]|nr:TIGR03557 family F420-dependent LLM class oxidoreductase [Actinomycetota bacterium]